MWPKDSLGNVVKSSLFWVITQQVVVIPYRFFRTTNWSHLQDDTNWLFCHRKILLSITRSDINFSTVLRAGQFQNRELRVMGGVCLGWYLSLQNVIHETRHIRVHLMCVCVCMCVCVRVSQVERSSSISNQYPVSPECAACIIPFQLFFFVLQLTHLDTNRHCSIAPTILIDWLLPSL